MLLGVEKCIREGIYVVLITLDIFGVLGSGERIGRSISHGICMDFSHLYGRPIRFNDINYGDNGGFESSTYIYI